MDSLINEAAAASLETMNSLAEECENLLAETLRHSGSGSLQSVFLYEKDGPKTERIRCTLCGVSIYGVANAIAHREGKKHRSSLRLIPVKVERKKRKIEGPDKEDVPIHQIDPTDSLPDINNNCKAEKENNSENDQEKKLLNIPASVETLLRIKQGLEQEIQELGAVAKVLDEPVEEQPPQIETIPLQLPLKPLNRIIVSSDPPAKMANKPELFLDLDKSPDESFVGVEYLVEMHLYDQEPRYHCVLCDKYGDPRTIIIHVASTAHRMKYFDKHYPSMMKELGELRYDKEARVAVIKVLEEVSMAVQKQHGRMQPLVVEESHYKGERMRYLQQIIGGPHYSEASGPSFINLVDKKKIANITRTVKLKADVKRTVAEAEAAKRTSLEAMNEKRSPRRRSFRSRTRSRSRSKSPRQRRQRWRSPSPAGRKRRSRSPVERRSREEQETLDKYSSMKTIAVKEVEVRYKEYELLPEKHPLYSSEWEAFWNRRFKELQAEGKDASSHDFKPEWVAFWIRRLKDLYNADVEAAKRDIKIKLGISPLGSPTRIISIDLSRDSRDRGDRKRRSSVERFSGDEDARDRDSFKRNRRDRSPSESSRGRVSFRQNSRSPSRSTVQSKRRVSRSPSLDRRERIRELDRIISRLPPASGSSRGGGGGEYGYGHDYDLHYSGGSRDRYLPPSGAYDRDETSSSTGVIAIEDDDEPLSIVSVLRILSALEEQLGSMGTKTLDLLGKALAMEKAKANSSDDLMMTENNAVFFETIKEKLKGQLITGVLNKSKVGAVKKAIRKIAEILHEITKKVAEVKKAAEEAEASKRTIVIKVAMDKAMIAQRIALALVTEKKTDVTPEQLEILINVFFEMLRKTKELNKKVTTQDYIELLEEQKVQSVAEKVDILGIIGNNKDKNNEDNDGIQRRPDKPVVRLDYDDEDPETGFARVQEETIDEEGTFESNGAAHGEAFTDSDLKTLLQNFRDLSSDEQQHLIKHLKKLESESPDRVEKLRKFVNFDGLDLGGGVGKHVQSGKSMSEELARRQNRWDDITEAVGATSKASDGFNIPGLGALAPVPAPVAAAVPEEEVKVKFDMRKKEAIQATASSLLDDDDDDDDYSFDDVVKAASKNLERVKSGTSGVKVESADKVKREKEQGKRGDKRRSVSPETKQISETHSLIANIMGSLQQQKKKTEVTAPAGSSGTVETTAGAAAAPGGSASGSDNGSKGNNKKGGKAAAPGSLPFYQQQQQNSSYNSTYQEQILQQQQYAQYQQQMQQGGYNNAQQQMMYQQMQQGNNGNQQWWGQNQNQNQMYPNQQPQQNFYGNYGQQQQYPNQGNGQNNNYGNYY